MASEAARSSPPSGVSAVVEEWFRVPTMPTILRRDAAQRVREKIEQDAVTCERLDLSEEPVHRRALVDMSGERVPFPPGQAYDRCYVALIDPDTRAQWGHRAFWAFVPADGVGAVVIQPTDFPEHALGAVRLFPVLPS
jgi:hypothetical protein